MRSRFRDSMLVMTTATAVAAVLWLAVRPTAGQAPPAAYRAPRTADGKPNLNGIWQALNTAFHSLNADDFEVVRLGWQGTAPSAPTNLRIIR